MKTQCELGLALGYPTNDTCARLSQRRADEAGVQGHLMDKLASVAGEVKLTPEQADARRRLVVEQAATFIKAYRRKMPE